MAKVHVIVRTSDDERRNAKARRIDDALVQEFGEGYVVQDGRVLFFEDTDDPRKARSRIAGFLDRESPDWSEYVKIA